jgi:hypothetical protein
MKSILKSKVFAVVLAFAVATPLTFSVSAAPAEAGIISSAKSAAKKVGGAVKNTAKGIGAAAKAGAAFGKQAGGVIAKYVPPVKGVVNAGKAVKVLVSGKR